MRIQNLFLKLFYTLAFQFLFISFLFLEGLRAEISPGLIRGVDGLIDPSCKEKISPVYAMGMIKSDTLAHIRFWGSYGRVPAGQEGHYPSCQWAGRWGRDNPYASDDCPLDATSALIQSLFPSHARTDFVANQGSKDDPISKLTPENIGSLIELIHNWNIPETGDPDPATAELWILQVYRALNLDDQDLKKTTFQALSLAQTQCEQYRQDHAPLGRLLENFQAVTERMDEHPCKKGQKVFDFDRSLAALKGTKKWKAIEPWAKILYRAVQESKQTSSLYPPSTPERALVSYLLKKGSDKKVFLDFLKSTPSCLSDQGRKLVHNYSSFQREIEIGTPPMLSEFLSSHFTPDELIHFKQMTTEEKIAHVNSDPERLGYYYYSSNLSDLPSLIGGQQAAHKSLGINQRSDRKYNLYPDCGEASVRNFFNILFYNSETKQFQPEILTQMKERHGLNPYRDISKKGKPDKVGVEKGLLAFYTRNPDSTQLASDRVRDDWSRRVISQLPGVNYIKSGGQCEMNAGIDNALQVLGHLLGDESIKQSGTPEKRKEALDRLCKISSREGFHLSWRPEHNPTPENTDEKLIFSINGKPRFQWEFMRGHFSLTEIQENSSTQTDWRAKLPKEVSSLPLMGIWESVKYGDYRRATMPMLWNQKLENSQLRLDLLDQVPWDPKSGPIAYHLTRDLSLQDEAVHRNSSVAAVKTQYRPLKEALSHVPEEVRARSAAYSGDLEALQKLNPTSLREKNSYGYTPAHWAAKYNSRDALRVIAEKAPDSLKEKDKYGYTPAHLAAQNNSLDALKVIAEKAPDSLKEKDKSGETPAHDAAKNNGLDTLRVIAEKAPDSLREKDSNGDTPAHRAAKSNFNLLNALRFIAEVAPDSLREKDRLGKTPAHFAAENNNLDILRVIAEKAPDTLEVKDNRRNRNTPLELISDPKISEILKKSHGGVHP